MAAKDKIELKATETAAIIDIAIEAIQKYPPKELHNVQFKLFLDSYEELKKSATNPAPKYRTLINLKDLKEDALIYFQEGSGEAVNFFWQTLKLKNVNVKRVNKLEKILKRNKISNQIEYDYIIDTIVPAQQDGLITEEQASKLSDMIGKFEKKK